MMSKSMMSKSNRLGFATGFIGCLLAAVPSNANAQAGGSDRGTASTVFREPIPNVPGKSLVAVVVTYAPGAKSPAHRHASSAFIYAHVLEGAIRSQVDAGPIKVYHAGEGWSESPGAHHRISENASATEPARLLAIFVVDADERALTVPDPK
jgi:quercetin dioxygenase-like cupin family protein